MPLAAFVKNAHGQFLDTDVPCRAITSVTFPPPSLPPALPVVRTSARSFPPGSVFPCARACVCICVCVAAAPGSRGENTALSFHLTPPCTRKVGRRYLARVSTRNREEEEEVDEEEEEEVGRRRRRRR